VENLRTQGIEVYLLCIPGQSGIPENDAADSSAKRAVGPEEQHPFQLLLASQKQQNKERMLQVWQKEWRTTDRGKHLRRVDDGSSQIAHRSPTAPEEEQSIPTNLAQNGTFSVSHSPKISRFSEDDK
jgi:hypothetical protein